MKHENITYSVLQDKSFVQKSCSNVLYIETDALQPWLRWGYWTSPFTYAQNAIALNEFLDKRWATVRTNFNSWLLTICQNVLFQIKINNYVWY
jgi:hypothetical protein